MTEPIRAWAVKYEFLGAIDATWHSTYKVRPTETDARLLIEALIRDAEVRKVSAPIELREITEGE
jgi:hypothetical protein